MIFVSVGSQLPFDRLIKPIDHWASEHKETTIFAQIGQSNFIPKHIEFCQTLDPINYDKRIRNAELIISHIGTGTIITALELNIPLLIMPRLAKKGECRNNHQLTTMNYFLNYPSIKIAENEDLLLSMLDQIIKDKNFNTNKVKTTISKELITTIKNFISE